MKKNFIIMVSSLAFSVVMFTGCLEKTASEYETTGKPINYGLSEALLRFRYAKTTESSIVVNKLVDTLRSVLRIQRCVDSSFEIVKSFISKPDIRLAAQNEKIISSKDKPSCSTQDNPEQVDVVNIVPLHLFTSSTDKLVVKEIYDLSQEYFYNKISEASENNTSDDEKLKQGLMHAISSTQSLLKDYENAIEKFQFTDTLKSVLRIQRHVNSTCKLVENVVSRSRVKKAAQKNKIISSKDEPSCSTQDNPEQVDVVNIVPLHLFTSFTDKLVAKEIHEMSQEYFYKGISEASVYATPDEKCKKGLMYAVLLTKTLLRNLENSIEKFQVVQIANYLYSKVHAIKDTQDRHDVKRTKNTLMPHDSKQLAPRHRKVLSAMAEEEVKRLQRRSQDLAELRKDKQIEKIQDENKYLLDVYLGTSDAPTLIRDIEYPLIFGNNYTLYASTEEVIAKLNNYFAQIYNGNYREIEFKVIAGYGYPGIIRSILAVYRIIQNDLNIYKLKSTKPKLSKAEKRNSIKDIDKEFSENNKWPDDQEVYASESEDESDTGSVVINSDQESDDQQKNN
ncbi:hypothetical protein KG892_04670 [Vermiphilus pyriformis]|nr:MAG: hypothetical protein KG892_04670 [Vermiphilus pyriformis]